MSWAVLWTRIKAIPDWLVALVLTLLFLKWVDYRAVQRTRREMFERQRREEAEARARDERTAREVTDDLQTRRTEAAEARDAAPRGLTADELRKSDPDLAGIVFGPDRRDGGEKPR
jgi:hypothetical protein